jgi:hypothetical protein
MTYLDLAVRGFWMQEAQARNPVKMFKVGVYVPQQNMLTDKQLLGGQGGDVDGHGKTRRGAGGTAGRADDILGSDRDGAGRRSLVGAGGLGGNVGKLAFGRRILAGQVGGVTALAPRQVAGAFCLVRVTLAACSLRPLPQSARLGVTLGWCRPRHLVGWFPLGIRGGEATNEVEPRAVGARSVARITGALDLAQATGTTALHQAGCSAAPFDGGGKGAGKLGDWRCMVVRIDGCRRRIHVWRRVQEASRGEEGEGIRRISTTSGPGGDRCGAGG